MTAPPVHLPWAFSAAHGVVAEPARHEAIAAGPAAALAVAVRAGTDPLALAEARRALRRPLSVRVVDGPRFETLLAQARQGAGEDAHHVADEIAIGAELASLPLELPAAAELLDDEHDAPVIRLVNALLARAARDGASDIHVEPFEERSVVRLRLDGTLRDLVEPHRALHAALVSRVKIMARLDIAERRLPQDGRIALRVAGRPLDVRVSTIPTAHGERVVLRLLDRQAARLDLATLGMDAATLARLDRLIRAPHGIVLVTGPTGSGKTTTLYAALRRLDARSLNIMTVEDPVEYDLDGISQTPVHGRIEMSFARALRGILRQDPDVVMVGEIRDLETAQVAVQAGLTGHLVFSTLHTQDSTSAVTRLVDMGVEPFLLASGLTGVVAQRLVRCLCTECRREVALSPQQAAEAGLPAGTSRVWRAGGCAACGGTGYRGRTGLYELMPMDDALRARIHDRAPEARLREQAVASGMVTLREDGVRRVLAGDTSLEELLRVSRE